MAQDLFDRHRARRALQQSYRCFAPIGFLAVAPTLRRKFWQPAGHGLMRAMTVRVLLPPGISWRNRVVLPHVMLSAGVPVLFLPSPEERHIRTIPKEARRRQTWSFEIRLVSAIVRSCFPSFFLKLLSVEISENLFLSRSLHAKNVERGFGPRPVAE